jgi:putative ABC transport system permease protein
MALGARRSEVIGLVLRESLMSTAIGLVLGVCCAAAITRFLEGMLFGLTPLDPTTFIAVSLLFGLVATLAAYVPAQRATKVDALIALRYE